jgi:hypothetical protein
MFVGKQHGRAREAVDFHVSIFQDGRLDSIETCGLDNDKALRIRVLPARLLPPPGCRWVGRPISCARRKRGWLSETGKVDPNDYGRYRRG